MGTELPDLLQFLHSDLGYDVDCKSPVLGYMRYTIDLSSLKLRLTDETPALWLRSSDLESVKPLHLYQSMQDVVRLTSISETILVILDGPSEPLLQQRRRSARYNLVFIGRDEQQQIINSRRPSGELLDIISSQVPISSLAPYETSAPVTGSLFFGRDYETKRILSSPETNFAILGIRRIGKTSLLREVRRILTDNTQRDIHSYIVYLDCSDLLTTEDFIRETVRKLNISELSRLHLQQSIFFFPDFLERMRRMYNHPILFLLDEIDNLIAVNGGAWDLFRMLRAASNKGACHYITAGYREAINQFYDPNGPLYNFAQKIYLNELNRKQAHDMIVVPMENLRVRIRNKDEVFNRIYEETAGHPNLIQHYCMVLLRQLDQSGEREINPNSLFDVYSDEDFRGHMLTSFVQNTENREKAVVYALLKSEEEKKLRSFSMEFIDDALRQQGISLSQREIDDSCNLLVLAGILHRKDRDYSFTSPVFTRMIQQSYDLNYLIRKLKAENNG